MAKILVLTEIEEILLDGEPFRIVHRNDEYGVPAGKDAQQARQVLVLLILQWAVSLILITEQQDAGMGLLIGCRSPLDTMAFSSPCCFNHHLNPHLTRFHSNGFVYLDIPTLDPEPTDDSDITALFDKIILAGRLHHPLSLTAQEATTLWQTMADMTDGNS